MEFGDSPDEVEHLKRFNLSPSRKTLLKKNNATVAVGLRELSKYGRNLSNGSSSRFDGGAEKSDMVRSILRKFCDLNFEENAKKAHDQRDGMISNLIHQIEDLESQVKERKAWAHQKALQAANKLSNDLIELKTLRMNRKETQKLKNGYKQFIEGTTMRRLIDMDTHMETSLQRASDQLDCAILEKVNIENENDEIRAEMEAYKLRASESEIIELEALKREKKCRKKLKVWEKEKKKLQDNIAVEKQMLLDLQQQLVESETAKKEAEAKWRQEQRAKEQALALLKEETRLNEEVKATNKRMLKDMRLTFEIESKQYKNDLQRLHQELSQLKASNEVPEGDVARMLHDFDRLEVSASKKDVSIHWKCIICKKGEVSILFLPCAHQIICANCNDNYEKKGRAVCPCCKATIEKRIWVFGATS